MRFPEVKSARMDGSGHTPEISRLIAAIDATWPAAELAEAGGFRLRRGAGGGKRVSAAMRAGGQAPLFRLTPSDERLDAALAARGYTVVDPTALYLGGCTALSGDEALPVAHAKGFMPVLMEEIFAEGGIGPSRLAVMDRVAGPSMRLLGRAGDRPSGTAFVAVDGEVAMVHAIVVRTAQRRRGVGRQLTQAAARFGAAHGARWLALAVLERNDVARALYEGLGMVLAGSYYYRTDEEAESR